MNTLIETVNSAVIYNVRFPLIAVIIVFLMLAVITAVFVFHELKKNKNDTE